MSITESERQRYKIVVEDDPSIGYYDWLFARRWESHKRYLVPRPEYLLQLREYIEDLDETAATVPVSNFIPDPVSGQRFSDNIIEYEGGWRCPETLPTNRPRFISPKYIHKKLYADKFVTCKCGARRLRSNREKHEAKFHEKHRDHCRIDWQKNAEWRLWVVRRKWLWQAAEYNLSLEYAADRMGISFGRAHKMSNQLGVHYRKLRNRGRVLRTNTACLLMECGYSGREAGEILGISGSVVHRNIARYNGRTPEIIRREKM